MGLNDWVTEVAKEDKALAALLRGLMDAQRVDGQVRFVWCSNWHRDEGSRREPDIRRHLKGYSTLAIVHEPLADVAARDTMLDEALKLGAKVKFTRGD
jgi:hypothetical protein